MLNVISRCCLWKMDAWVSPALLKMLKGWKISVVDAQTIWRPLHHIGPMASSGDNAQKCPQTSRLKTWVTGTMSCRLMRPRLTYLVQMMSSVRSSNQVGSTKASVCWLQLSMMVGVLRFWRCMRAANTEELQFIEGTVNANILKKRMTPSLF